MPFVLFYLVSQFISEDNNVESKKFHHNKQRQTGGKTVNPYYPSCPVENAGTAYISKDLAKKWKKEFYASEKNILAQNIMTMADPLEIAIDRKRVEHTDYTYNFMLEDAKPRTNQKGSQLCWAYSALNCIRVPFMRDMNLREFEFSQSYIFFWDRIEKSYWFLNNIVYALQKGEKLGSRLFNHLTEVGAPDTGQFIDFVNIVSKYGLMPKECFKDCANSEFTTDLVELVNSKLREYASNLADMFEKEKCSISNLNSKVQEQMKTIFKITGICLGVPDDIFVWEYYDRKGKFHSIGPITPLDFYRQYVKPSYVVTNKVVIEDDPRSEHPYGQLYVVDCLGNCVGGPQACYINLPAEKLMELVVENLKLGEPVWIGVDYKYLSPKLTIMDSEILNFEDIFDTKFMVHLSKCERVVYKMSSGTHAMTITGAMLDERGKPTKFRVENSYGPVGPDNGNFMMTAEWFKNFVFQIAVDYHILEHDTLQIYNTKPIVLAAWDPLFQDKNPHEENVNMEEEYIKQIIFDKQQQILKEKQKNEKLKIKAHK